MAPGRGSSQWRLIEPGSTPRPGAENMAIDQAVAGGVNAGSAPALRFYYWDPPCLSLGRNQPAVGVYDAATAGRRGVDIVRRPTGGRAVLHDRELTYCVTVPVGELGSPRETYSRINRALVAGLRRIGVAARVVEGAPGNASSGDFAAGDLPRGRSSPADALGSAPCFDLAAPGEVVADGRKLIGSAQRKEGHTLLQHGSLLLEGDQSLVVELLCESATLDPAELALRTAMLPVPASLRELLGRLPAREELERALVEGFQDVLGIGLAPAALSSAEREDVGRWTDHFRSAAWTWRR